MPSKKNETFNFEKSLDELTKLVNKVEQGNLPLEQSLQYFEQGVGLIRSAQTALQKAEQKVQILTKKGNETLTSFNADVEDE